LDFGGATIGVSDGGGVDVAKGFGFAGAAGMTEVECAAMRPAV
jgi:hypothetical protein